MTMSHTEIHYSYRARQTAPKLSDTTQSVRAVIYHINRLLYRVAQNKISHIYESISPSSNTYSGSLACFHWHVMWTGMLSCLRRSHYKVWCTSLTGSMTWLKCNAPIHLMLCQLQYHRRYHHHHAGSSSSSQWRHGRRDADTRSARFIKWTVKIIKRCQQTAQRQLDRATLRHVAYGIIKRINTTI